MKAVVVELNNDHAAVLSDNGCIVTIRNKSYKLGQVIILKSPKVILIKKITVIAATAAAFLFMSTATWAYASPFTYVSVDVNPSIEFCVNRFDRVIKVKAINNDGKNLLEKITLDNLKNHTIIDAISSTVDQMSDSGYFDADAEGGIIIATSCKNEGKAVRLAQKLKSTVEKEIVENGDQVVVESLSITQDRLQEAKNLGVTPAKYELIDKLQEAAADSTNINIDEWLDKPVKEIMKATKDYRKSNKVNKNSQKDTTKDNFSESNDPTDVHSQEDSITSDHKASNSDIKPSLNESTHKDKSDSSIRNEWLQPEKDSNYSSPNEIGKYQYDRTYKKKPNSVSRKYQPSITSIPTDKAHKKTDKSKEKDQAAQPATKKQADTSSATKSSHSNRNINNHIESNKYNIPDSQETIDKSNNNNDNKKFNKDKDHSYSKPVKNWNNPSSSTSNSDKVINNKSSEQ